jgi:hypothetical protein
MLTPKEISCILQVVVIWTRHDWLEMPHVSTLLWHVPVLSHTKIGVACVLLSRSERWPRIECSSSAKSDGVYWYIAVGLPKLADSNQGFCWLGDALMSLQEGSLMKSNQMNCEKSLLYAVSHHSQAKWTLALPKARYCSISVAAVGNNSANLPTAISGLSIISAFVPFASSLILHPAFLEQ